MAANDTIKGNYPKVRKGGLLLDLRKPQRACALRPKWTTARPKKVGGIKKSNGTRIRIRNGLYFASFASKKKKLKRGRETEKRQGGGERGLKRDSRKWER